MSARPLRLGYLVPEFPAQTHAFFWREAEALREAGVELRWCSTRRPPPDACRHAFAERARRETRYLFPPRLGAALVYLLRHPLRAARALAYSLGLGGMRLPRRVRLFGMLLCAADLAAECRRHPLDHLHVHSCADAAHVAALFNHLTGVSYSLTLHGDLQVYGEHHAQKMARAAFVSVVTSDLRRQVIEQVGLAPERVPLVRMGVDLSRFVARAEPERAPGPLRVVTVARLAECKGHGYALRALRALADEGLDVSYDVAGDGPDRAAVVAEVERLGLQANVRFLGSLAEDDVLALIQGADAFVLPSVGHGEAAPVAVMEAMACGTPVVCSIIGGTPELVRDGEDGFLVAQRDVDGLAAALRRLAREPDTHRRLAHAARERALAAFDHRRWAAALLDRITPA